MATLLIEQQALAKFGRIFLMGHLALFAVIKDQVPGLLPMGCQRRLSSRWFAKGFMYELPGKVLDHMNKTLESAGNAFACTLFFEFSEEKSLSMRLGALLHDADDRKYFTEKQQITQNLQKTAFAPGS